MGEINRAKERIYLLLPKRVVSDELETALSDLYALGVEHGEAEAEYKWEQRTEALRELARTATVFAGTDDPDEAYDHFKAALDAWWRVAE